MHSHVIFGYGRLSEYSGPYYNMDPEDHNVDKPLHGDPNPENKDHGTSMRLVWALVLGVGVTLSRIHMA